MYIRYYGHVGHSSGYGRAATELCMALRNAPGVKLEICPIQVPGVELKLAERHLPLASCLRSDGDLGGTPDVVIIHTLPQDCARGFNTVWQRGPTYIAYTTWEALDAPDALLTSLTGFDQVWVPSDANLLAFARGAAPAIRVLPHAFDEATYQRPGASVRPEGPYRFYYVGAWTARKNPAALIRAFAHAFPGSDDAELVLQCAGASGAAINMVAASTGLAPAQLRGIRPSISARSDEYIADMHATADCFVTASRGEAWNLPAFDAMLAGRHVIAPKGQGSDDFLAGTSAALYESRPGIVQVDVRMPDPTKPGDLQIAAPQGLTAECRWLEPDLLQLAKYMREAARTRTRDIRLSYDPRERFGYKAVAARALSYIEEISTP